jgi:hypothetical protein
MGGHEKTPAVSGGDSWPRSTLLRANSRAQAIACTSDRAPCSASDLYKVGKVSRVHPPQSLNPARLNGFTTPTRRNKQLLMDPGPLHFYAGDFRVALRQRTGFRGTPIPRPPCFIRWEGIRGDIPAPNPSAPRGVIPLTTRIHPHKGRRELKRNQCTVAVRPAKCVASCLALPVFANRIQVKLGQIDPLPLPASVSRVSRTPRRFRPAFIENEAPVLRAPPDDMLGSRGNNSIIFALPG